MWDNFIIPAPRFSGTTGIRRHHTLQPFPATPVNKHDYEF